MASKRKTHEEMTDKLIEKEDLFNVIKYGHRWHAEKIKEILKIFIDSTNASFANKHIIQWDSDEKCHFIYDNECNLIIFDGKIELRCDRENVFSSDQTVNFPIKNDADIEFAYKSFKSMTMESDDD